MPGVIVPRKTVGELRKLLEDDDAMIAVSVSETKVRFATPAITLTSKVIDGTFPDYTRVIPTGNTRKLEVDAAEFAKAVDRVATVSSERSRAVKLSLEEDRLILSVNAPDSGAAEEELAVAYGDERLEIGFNAKYLLEIASQVDRENAVFLFNSAADPTLMREGNDTSPSMSSCRCGCKACIRRFWPSRLEDEYLGQEERQARWRVWRSPR
jgi:DNA polymerase-3 subunit beta